jgi:predicted nucleic acid-binding Zn ribbon protein
VTGENPSAARFDAAHGNLPLINRVAELQQLCAAWQEVVHGRGRDLPTEKRGRSPIHPRPCPSCRE